MWIKIGDTVLNDKQIVLVRKSDPDAYEGEGSSWFVVEDIMGENHFVEYEKESYVDYVIEGLLKAIATGSKLYIVPSAQSVKNSIEQKVEIDDRIIVY